MVERKSKSANPETLATLVCMGALLCGVSYEVSILMLIVLYALIGLGTLTITMYATLWWATNKVSATYHMVERAYGEAEAKGYLSKHSRILERWADLKKSYREGEHMHPITDLFYYGSMMAGGIQINQPALVVMLGAMCVFDLSFRAESDKETTTVSVKC